MQTFVEIETDLGMIQGVEERILGKAIQKFIGIPYGLPPIGKLRFQKPLPCKKWVGVKKCVEFPCAPWQRVARSLDLNSAWVNKWNPTEQFDEDCLYLNIWKNNESNGEQKQSKRPVMVWLYGGGFVSGSSSLAQYDGSVLATQSSVIIISISYRVGSLGFLYLNENAPGNQGLWDQLLALKWIKTNIDRFGGDPDNITLFGESAGAVSVCCHLLSPYSAQYFHKAIMQSGCALNYWAILSADEMRRRSELLCKLLSINCDKSSEEKLDGLRQVEPQLLIEKQWVCEGSVQVPFTPIVDYDFLPDWPATLFSQQKFKACPIIIGNNEDEGSLYLIYNDQLMNFIKGKDKINDKEFNKLITLTLEYFPHFPETTSSHLIEQIVSQYRPPGDVQENLEKNLKAAGQALGHCQFAHHSLQIARQFSAQNNAVYLYHFNYRAQNDPLPVWLGVKHSDEIQFLFGAPLREKTYNDFERQLSIHMMNWWTNFAKFGNPTYEESQEWLPFNNDEELCFCIETDVNLKNYHLSEVHEFWESLERN